MFATSLTLSRIISSYRTWRMRSELFDRIQCRRRSGVVETLTKSLRIQNPRYNKSLVLEAWLLLHAMPTWEGWNWYKCMTFAHQDRPDYPIEAQQYHDGPSHKQIEELSSHLYPSHLPYYSGIVTVGNGTAGSTPKSSWEIDRAVCRWRRSSPIYGDEALCNG